MLVSADTGSRKLLKVLDSKALEIRLTPESRTLQALDAAGLKPLPKTYVKVYAELDSGEKVFHKDGYAVLRGKFDCLTPASIRRRSNDLPCW